MSHRRPNILIVISHDLGRHLNCYGVKTVKSPNLDALAAGGVRLANAFCVAPQCSPSRAGMFTGRYPHSNGVLGLTHSDFAWDLHPDEIHLAGVLRGAGYETAVISNPHEVRDPLRIGYDRWLEPHKSDSADAIAAEVASFIRGRGESQKPFFLQVNFFEPHRARIGFGSFGAAPDYRDGVIVPPFLVDELSSQEEFAYFQGAIRVLDDGFGRIQQSLRDAKIEEDTLVIFAADHGIPFPRAKCSLYDPGLEITLMMRWPGGGLGGGSVIEPMISNIDVSPTVLDLLELPTPQRVQGRSFAPLLRGGEQAREELFAEMTHHDYCDPRRCIRTRAHKLIANFSNAPSFMNPSQTYRPRTITRHPRSPAYSYHEPLELYDLAADPLETRNLAAQPQAADLVSGLGRRLHEWMRSTGDPLLDGIPAPPIYHRTMAALREGRLGPA